MVDGVTSLSADRIAYLEELVRRNSGVKNESKLNAILVEKVAHAFEYGRFAGAYFARKHNKALAAANPINEIGQRLLMLRAAIEELRIRTEIERALFEPEIRVIHSEPGVCSSRL